MAETYSWRTNRIKRITKLYTFHIIIGQKVEYRRRHKNVAKQSHKGFPLKHKLQNGREPKENYLPQTDLEIGLL
jgi:hypothetical protein